MIPVDVSIISDEADLRQRYPQPMSRASDKVCHLDPIAGVLAVLFCVLSSQGDDGADISPRGDPPGFLRALDDRHLLLPDRIGNNRLDNFANILGNPEVGLLVLVPGMGETLRINGRARLTDDARLLAECEVQGRVPHVLITKEACTVPRRLSVLVVGS